MTKLEVIKELVNRKYTNNEAGLILGLKKRQVIRLKKKYLQTGSLEHGLIGKESNNPPKKELRMKAMEILRQKKYKDFGPLLAKEHLESDYEIVLGYETVRQDMISGGLWKEHKRRKSIYRSRREPKAEKGEMIQYDGSYERWFEERGEKTCILLAVDDADSTLVLIKFCDGEGVRDTFKFWKEYILTYGKPFSIYLDKFSTYKVNNGDDPRAKTQFGNAMESIGIVVIHAETCQAKGRVEIRFKTLQDRLIKEMRLLNISTIEEANKYCKETFVPWFNKRYGMVPSSPGNRHQELTKNEKDDLNLSLAEHSIKRINSDFTIYYEGNYYQLLETEKVTMYRKENIVVIKDTNGVVYFEKKGILIENKKIDKRPERTHITALLPKVKKKKYVPPTSHPYKKASYQFYLNTKH